MFWYFVFFVISGFCGILYELIWLRLAMAQFGVTTVQVSIVLSAFMGGLGFGSVGTARFLRRYGERIQFPPLRLYAAAEFLIGCSALLVPYELAIGHRLISHSGSADFSSLSYSLISGACVAVALVPWCACMGATIPLAMFAVRSGHRSPSGRSFSFLYAANVLGAVLGAILPLAVIELRGFHSTLKLGMLLNFLIAAGAFALTFRQQDRRDTLPKPQPAPATTGDRRILALLFLTGITSMGMEVVWIRLFTPFVGVMVYSFAMILVSYLIATFLGSLTHNLSSRNKTTRNRLPWAGLSVLAVLPVWSATPADVYLPVRLLLGIVPFSFAIGFLTPRLVDLWSEGDAERAGRAYAINVLGCVLGPLIAGFILLPALSERWSLLLFAAPWLVIGSANLFRHSPVARTWKQPATTAAFLTLTLVLTFVPKRFEKMFRPRVVLRDSTATVIAAGNGMDKHLLVNGVGITSLTPITKTMAHLPLAFLDHPPESVLDICFGMGTTFRSVLTWGIRGTAVDLVPSVPKLFWFFHSDAPQVLQSPLARIIIDDGRRYLERTPDQFDVITIDPPPPVAAAGSSLLYSTEFYAIAKQRLKPHGILQQWLPDEDDADSVVHSSVARALKISFPYLRVFHSVEGSGYHFLASDFPIPQRTAEELVAKLNTAAAKDFVEWGPEATPQAQFDRILKNELPLDQLISEAPQAPALQDDHPTNEYFILRNAAAADPDESMIPKLRLSARVSLQKLQR